jgi:hypothetical protein
MNIYIPHTTIPPNIHLNQIDEIKLFCDNYYFHKTKELIFNYNHFKPNLINYFYLEFNNQIKKITIQYPYYKTTINDFLVIIYFNNKLITNYSEFNLFKFIGYKQKSYDIKYIKPYIYKIIISKINI